MKKLLLFVVFILFNLNCYSQIAFEEGYFIEESGERIEGLIKNVDWKNNPTSFEYKLSENGEVKTADIDIVKEFGIKDVSKYQRYTVKIDRSNSSVNEMSIKREAEFETEELFLQVLVEGQATLYDYEDGNLRRYFFQINDGDVNQLVYKKYKALDNPTGENNFSGGIKENNLYKQQLFNQVNCKDFSMDDFEDIDYKKNDLTNHFMTYNSCKGSTAVNYAAKQQKDLFNLNVKLGLNYASMMVTNNTSTTYDFGGKATFSLGAEAEFILPFNKNKWSIIIEPTYHYFNGVSDTGFQEIEANYHSIELPLGVRHYFFLNDKSKIFLNGLLVMDFGMGSTVDINAGFSLDIEPRESLALGAGYNLNDKYNLELRYYTDRQILAGYRSWNGDYSKLSLVFGYNLF